MNLARWVSDLIDRRFGERIFFATVDSTSGNTVKVKRVGQADPDNTFYPAASGLAATIGVGDKVKCTVVGDIVYVESKVTT